MSITLWRANQIRNRWVTQGKEAAGFIDAAEFEELRKDDRTIKRWIDDQLLGTKVTLVLIGSDTSNSPYVQYELQKSYVRGETE